MRAERDTEESRGRVGVRREFRRLSADVLDERKKIVQRWLKRDGFSNNPSLYCVVF